MFDKPVKSKSIGWRVHSIIEISYCIFMPQMRRNLMLLFEFYIYIVL